MVRQVVVVAAVVAVVAGWAAAEPCYSCSHSGKHSRFGTAGRLSQAGSYAYSQSHSSSSSFSNAQSHAQSHAQSYAQSHAQSNAQSHAQSHAQSQAQSHAQRYALNHAGINRGLGGRHNVGHPTGCPGCGCGGCSGSCGWCGGSYGRRKRSTDGLMQSVDVQNLYDAISSEDKDQCGLRLVCELAQLDPRDLVDDEVQILLPYRGAGESDGTAYGQYDEAAWHGQEGHSCAEHYLMCSFTAQQIMDEYRKEVATSNKEN